MSVALGRRATACGGTVRLGGGRKKSTTEQVRVNQESLTYFVEVRERQKTSLFCSHL